MGHKLTKDWATQQIQTGKYDQIRMVTVTDNWFSNFPDDQIEVNINIWMPERNKAVVSMSAHGNDDESIYLRSELMSPENAIYHYKHWKEYIFDKIPNGCNHEWFFEHGFYYD